MMYFNLLYVIAFSLWVSVAAPLAYAQSNLVPTASWDESPVALLLSYREVWGEFKNQDATPSVRIYGDGRVLIHYPVYSPKAGQYEYWLKPQELDNLIQSMLNKEMMSFKPESVNKLKSSAEIQIRQAALNAGESELFMVADDSTSVFNLYLSSYQPAGVRSGGVQSGSSAINKNITWLGLATDAQRYSHVQPIQHLRAIELEIKALMEKSDMQRINQ